ncbi:uncharacterized protein LOC117609777 [Osmia lignaria lignaria]|uniref:uncharacterized protein LOC117609777 n=1 Tax=Osmia lignaria lignaria TaxID=1437193 RepID=UPI00402BEA77
MYCFTRDFSYEDTANEVYDVGKDEDILSTNKLLLFADDSGSSRLQNAGGVNEAGSAIVVQIDVAKFGKRKYNRGRIVDGHWVLGMVDTSTNDCGMVVVQDGRRQH